ncbi:hypothetical protein ASG84_16595 [Rhodococcus sp. Leaf278]|uniref:hypothetical protein n=1 Tax=Rhodococcus sp. Leaf278 TaxID=1736319 RepID=UPI00070EB27B|nr:hypothetical protein [Rhodococcus sp. Leaf278]KQU58246.1 hypothetical protein ASG84_16595 [Rhodococcus sp. Leaf278]
MPAFVEHDTLSIACPEVHHEATMRMTFQRTLRVPDDGTEYNLPPGLGSFPLRQNDSADGALLPMWQSEACWIDFSGNYPFLVTVAAGSINVVTGSPWSARPNFEEEDYFEVPEQPWLDGFNVGEGTVRQFVAMPLGAGYTVEEQLSTEPAIGGIRVAAYPLKATVWDARPPSPPLPDFIVCAAPASDMGLGGGGSIRQTIASPLRHHDDWDLDHGIEFTVDIANSDEWQHSTGEVPPTMPPSAADYTRAGLPWFLWYNDFAGARRGSAELANTKSVKDQGTAHGAEPLSENESFDEPMPTVLGGHYTPKG